MAVTATPVFPQTPKVGDNQWVNGSTANTRSDGVGTIGTSMILLFTAGSNGAVIKRIRLSPTGAVASTATTATCARIYYSTITSGATTAADTQLIAEIACPAQTTAQPTAATNYLELPLDITIPASATILASMHHVAAANTTWQFVVFGSDL